MSKFDKIFEARVSESELNESAPVKKTLKNKVEKKIPLPKNSNFVEVSETLANDRQQSKRGRPPAKRSDPDFVGFTTYVRRDTHLRAKIALLQEGNGRELSQLVEDLIFNWLTTR